MIKLWAELLLGCVHYVGFNTFGHSTHSLFLYGPNRRQLDLYLIAGETLHLVFNIVMMCRLLDKQGRPFIAQFFGAQHRYLKKYTILRPETTFINGYYKEYSSWYRMVVDIRSKLNANIRSDDVPVTS